MKRYRFASLALSVLAAILVASVGKTLGREIATSLTPEMTTLARPVAAVLARAIVFFVTPKTANVQPRDVPIDDVQNNDRLQPQHVPVEERLQKAVDEVNREVLAHPRANDLIRIVGATAGPGKRVTLRFAVHGITQLNNDQIRAVYEGDRDRLCSNKGSLKDLLGEDVSFHYLYEDEDGAWTKDIVVEKQDCQVAATEQSSAEYADQGVTPAAKPAIQVSLSVLVQEYADNEFAAAAKYEDLPARSVQCYVAHDFDQCRTVLVPGVVVQKMGREGIVPYIDLVSRDQPPSVRAYFEGLYEGKGPQAEALQAIRNGQEVSVRCTVQYLETFGVRLHDCVLLS